MLELVMVAGLALFAGLWWGERGRRLDAQKWADGRKVTRPLPARVQGEPPPPGFPKEERVGTASAPLIDEDVLGQVRDGIARDYGIDGDRAERVAQDVLLQLHGNAGIG